MGTLDVDVVDLGVVGLVLDTLDHVEPAEELKVEDALLRSPAEPVVEPGRCGVAHDSDDAPMLF